MNILVWVVLRSGSLDTALVAVCTSKEKAIAIADEAASLEADNYEDFDVVEVDMDVRYAKDRWGDRRTMKEDNAPKLNRRLYAVCGADKDASG